MPAARSFVSRFSPNRTDSAILEAIFVQRHKLAEIWLERLRDSILTGVKHHLLAIGPRGSGKSHLVTLLVHRLRQDKMIAGRVRVARLPEDETTSSFWKFLLRILRALNTEYGDEIPLFPPQRLNDTTDDRRSDLLSAHLLEKLAGRTLLVVVENLDDVMRGLKSEGQKRWRAFLQKHAAATTLATAQQLTPDLADRTKPFHGFFQVENLLPLTAEEALSLLHKLAELSGNRELAEYLDTPMGRARVRAIRHITGGSHRVFIIMSEFVTRQALDNLVTAFEELLDELTPYYQERLRWLPDQQREIVEFLCRQVRTVPVKEIAENLYLSEQTAAAQLKSLKGKRYVVAATVSRESRYQLAEPMMRLCVEVKDPQREPIRLIVEFLRIWYERNEVTTRLECLSEDAELERRYYRAVLQTQRPDTLGAAEEAFNQDLEAARNNGDEQEIVRVLVDLSMTANSAERCMAYAEELSQMDWHEEALAAWKRTVQLGPSIADAWVWVGYELDKLGRHTEALTACEKAIEINPNNDDALNNKGCYLCMIGRYEDALTAFDRALEIAPDDLSLNSKGFCLIELNRYEQALITFEAVIGRNEWTDTAWHGKGKRTGTAWRGKGKSLFFLGRYEEALLAFEQAIELNPNDADTWSDQGFCLSAIGRYEEALTACDRAIDLEPKYARAWVNRGRASLGLRQFGDATRNFRRAIELSANYRYALESLAETCLLTGNWSEAEKQLSHRFHLLETSPTLPSSAYLPDCVTAVFRASSESGVWAASIDRLATCAHEVQQKQAALSADGAPSQTRPLALLANALVRSLSRPVYDGAPAELLTSWAAAWRKAALKFPDLSLGARLFETGIRYKQTKDSRVLLDLVQEERSILSELFHLDDDNPAAQDY